MNIWIFNHYAVTPDMSGGTRHYDFAKELISRGHSVSIIASSFHYSKNIEMREYDENKDFIIENIEGIDFIWLKTPSYSGNGISRIRNMIAYSYKAISIIPKLELLTPDIVIGSSVHLFAVYSAYRIAKKFKKPFIMEVRDLWPQTLIDLGIPKWHPFIIFLGFLERLLYKKSDQIITSLPYAFRYIEKYVPESKIHWISNGTDISQIDNNVSHSLLKKDKFNVLYTGTHGLANNLHVLIQVADILKENENIHFTLIGDGPLKDSLIREAHSLELNNITFLNSVSKKDVFTYLKNADLLYVSLKDLPLYRYGMSMNKVFDYLAAKKPVLFVSDIEDNVIETAKAGIVVKNNDPVEVANAIVGFNDLPENEINQYGKNGFSYLEKNFSVKVLVDKLEKILSKVQINGNR